VCAVKRIPLRPDWPLTQSQLCLLWRAVRLAVVTRQASQHAVIPPRLAALSTRHDVVNRQFLCAGLTTTVLAGVEVTLENVSPAKRDCRRPT